MEYFDIYLVLAFGVAMVGLYFRPPAIRVKALRLVDYYGRVRASLDTSADGKPGLWFYDNMGRPVAVFGLLAENAPRFSPLGPTGVKEKLIVGKESVPGLMLLDAIGRVRVVVDLDRDGAPRVSLRDASGNVLPSVP